jgi:hypothetical protein
MVNVLSFFNKIDFTIKKCHFTLKNSTVLATCPCKHESSLTGKQGMSPVIATVLLLQICASAAHNSRPEKNDDLRRHSPTPFIAGQAGPKYPFCKIKKTSRDNW